MGAANPTRCFTCGLPVGEPAQLNRLTDGKPCPACRDRLLESLPSIVPTRRRELAGERPDREERLSRSESIESHVWLDAQDEGR
jgi:hypothetical protein